MCLYNYWKRFSCFSYRNITRLIFICVYVSRTLYVLFVGMSCSYVSIRDDACVSIKKSVASIVGWIFLLLFATDLWANLDDSPIAISTSLTILKIFNWIGGIVDSVSVPLKYTGTDSHNYSQAADLDILLCVWNTQLFTLYTYMYTYICTNDLWAI